MAVSTSDILNVLAAYDIRPFEDDLSGTEVPASNIGG